MVTELQQLLVKMLFESYGIEKHSEKQIESTTYLLRFLKYRNTEIEKYLGFKGHTDKSFLTILHQNHVKGLEIITKDGDWVSYEPSSSHCSFAVIAGDLCMVSHYKVITIIYWSFYTKMVRNGFMNHNCVRYIYETHM